MTNGTEGLDSETYRDERRLLVDGENQAASRFDRGMLTLAGGALLFSIAFLKDFATPKPNAHWSLFGSWLLFVTAIAAMLVSLLTSQSAYRRQRDILDSARSDPNMNQQNAYSRATHWLNLASIASFILAALGLAYFVWKNTPGTQGE